MTGFGGSYWFNVFRYSLQKTAAQVSKTTRGQWKDRLFVREEARDKTNRLKLRSFQRDLSVWKPQFWQNRFWRTSTETLSCASKRDSWQLWSGHHHPVLCSSTRGQGDSHPWGWGVLQKNIIGWIGDFRRSHQVVRHLTSSWHQKTTWTQKGGL